MRVPACATASAPTRSTRLLPDPASRFQPEGPHGPSEIVDPGTFRWTDRDWRGRPREEMVVYEMHVGSFTPEGSWEAAARELPELAALGITCIELMPVADFPGRFGWGYDGVDLFAPTRLYGRPDDFRRFVDRAHAHGIAVILDVVYNHFGPDGNYLTCFSQSYFTDRYENEWGDADQFRRSRQRAGARVLSRQCRLLDRRVSSRRAAARRDAADFRRLGRQHHGRDRAAGARGGAAIGRPLSSARTSRSTPRLVRPPERGGYGLDALWNDDFHHSAMVALTGRREAYYTDYRGAPREFVAAAKYGFLYQGQHYVWQKQRRGTPALDLPAETRVVFLQNHDQVANSAAGLRVHALTSPGRWRAMTALSAADAGHPDAVSGPGIRRLDPVPLFRRPSRRSGRGGAQGPRASSSRNFPSIADPEMQRRLADPADEETFRRCVLDLGERERHAPAYALHRDLLALRRDDPVLGRRPARVDGAVDRRACLDAAVFRRGFRRTGPATGCCSSISDRI